MAHITYCKRSCNTSLVVLNRRPERVTKTTNTVQFVLQKPGYVVLSNVLDT